MCLVTLYNNITKTLQTQVGEEGWYKIYNRPREAGILEESYTRINIIRLLVGKK